MLVLCTGFRDAKVKAAMTKVIPGEWGLGSTSGRTLQHTKVCSAVHAPPDTSCLVLCPSMQNTSWPQVP